MLLLEAPFVAIVKLEVTGVLPGVTDADEKLHTALAGNPPHDRATAWP